VEKETSIANTEEKLTDGASGANKENDATGGVVGGADDASGGWLLWSQYRKEIINGEEFAIVGNRRYSKEAVEQAVPGQFGLPPMVVEDVIQNGTSFTKVEKGITQTVFDKDRRSLRVVTEDNGRIVRTLSKVDYDAMDIPGLIQHIKIRNPLGLKKGISGCHDATEFGRVSRVSATGYQVPVGKTIDEVPEIVVFSDIPHPKGIPGVRVVEYRVHRLGQSRIATTDGTLRGKSMTEPFRKTIYDPTIWPDSKLDELIRDAFQDAHIKQKGIFSFPDREYIGVTKEGYEIGFYFRDNRIQTYFFL
jgi:hypothetical protein